MTALNESIRNIPMPMRMQHLPVSPKGFPIPWFVHNENGVLDFRVIGTGKIERAIRFSRCWLCGEMLGRHVVFTVGPMCCVNRMSAEPPSHRDCAEYGVKACPFLSKPKMRRNEVNQIEGGRPMPGIAIQRNPGATALWVTRNYDLMRVEHGVLFRMGDPEKVAWYAEGRSATKAEVMHSVQTGLPLLEEAANKEGPEAIAELAKAMIAFHHLLNAEGRIDEQKIETPNLPEPNRASHYS